MRAKKSHIWDRDPHDWYVEPKECSLALFRLEQLRGSVWDPACGMGRIVEAARETGLSCYGSDIVKRSEFCSEILDFFKGNTSFDFKNIVSNPPLGCAEEFVLKALKITPFGGKVVMLLPLVWLTGFSSKRNWLPASPLCRLYPISPRPSMPPGEVIMAGERPGNGTKDFAWFVWCIGQSKAPEIVFMNTRKIVSENACVQWKDYML